VRLADRYQNVVDRVDGIRILTPWRRCRVGVSFVEPAADCGVVVGVLARLWAPQAAAASRPKSETTVVSSRRMIGRAVLTNVVIDSR